MAEAQVSGYQSQASAPRERKFSAVELGPNGGIVEMADLASEDQALAQFGYKPVYTHPFHYCFTENGKSVDGLWAFDNIASPTEHYLTASNQPIGAGSLTSCDSCELALSYSPPSAHLQYAPCHLTSAIATEYIHCDFLIQ